MTDLLSKLNARIKEIDIALDAYLEPSETAPEPLFEAMRYCVLGGGKRIRPFLILETSEALGGDNSDALVSAVAMELVHTYSLVHDDLPSMDNDDLRRGRATCHKKYNEWLAILTGDALLTTAIELIVKNVKNPTRAVKLIRELTSAAGSSGMIAGQVRDMTQSTSPVSLNDVHLTHDAKTGAMIKASVKMGGICANADDATLSMLGKYSEALGRAFQVVDDILDETSSTDVLGKTAGKDKQSGKRTYPAVIGLEKSKQVANELVEEACLALGEIKSDTSVLADIAKYILERTN